MSNGLSLPHTRVVEVEGIKIGGKNPLVLIAGPCVIESEDSTTKIAKRLKEIARSHNIPLIFKSSYDKANRTSLNSYRGPGVRKGLRILKTIKDKLKIPLLSDVHSIDEILPASKVLDILQIPAFLCRQTDLIVTAAKSGKPINIKKGQFLAPWDVENIIKKITSAGNRDILLTERGVSFGYNNLVADMRSLPLMRRYGYPVVFDATHSIQLPGGRGNASGGDRDMIPYIARAAVAAGCDALFLEVHDSPEKALCDGPNTMRLEDLPSLLSQVKMIDEIVRGRKNDY